MSHTVRALLLNTKRQCLLVQHNERDPNDVGKWATVGGGVDENESHETCLLRELGEEFGESIVGKVKIGPRLLVNSRPDRTDHFYVAWFEGEDVSPIAHDEILKHGWFSTEDVRDLKLFFGFEGDLLLQALAIDPA